MNSETPSTPASFAPKQTTQPSGMLPVFLAFFVFSILVIGGVLGYAFTHPRSTFGATVLQALNPRTPQETKTIHTSTSTQVIAQEEKLTFTNAQLIALQKDLTLMYATYKKLDRTKASVLDAYKKDMNSIFLKDLGVDDALGQNKKVLFYPEIQSIIKSISGTSTPAVRKFTFTSNQLAALKHDLLLFVVKIKYTEKETYKTFSPTMDKKDPLYKKVSDEMEAIYLKNIGVPNISTTNRNVLLYPEVRSAFPTKEECEKYVATLPKTQ